MLTSIRKLLFKLTNLPKTFLKLDLRAPNGLLTNEIINKGYHAMKKLLILLIYMLTKWVSYGNNINSHIEKH